MALLHPFTHEPLTPEQAYAACLEAHRRDTEEDRLMEYVLRQRAKGPHKAAIDQARDDRALELARAARESDICTTAQGRPS